MNTASEQELYLTSEEEDEIWERINNDERITSDEVKKKSIHKFIDSDFTKLTQAEREALEKADSELMNNETIRHEDIWN